MNDLQIRRMRLAIKMAINDSRYDQQIEKMNTLARIFPMQCTLVEKQPTSEYLNYPCHAFSLGIHKNRDVLDLKREIFSGDMRTFEWSAFQKFRREMLSRIQPQEVQSGDIVFYLRKPEEHEWKFGALHSGVCISSTEIVSKWGRNADIWKHQIDHVSSTYEDIFGNISVAYFRINSDARDKYLSRLAIQNS